MTSRNSIRLATAADVEAVARSLAIAFQDEPVSRWLVPDPVERAELWPGQLTILIERAIDHGAVYTTTEHAGVIVWLDRTRPIPAPPADHRARLARACGRWIDRFDHVHALLDRHHPTAPHHYLAVGGVHPDHRSTGLHTAMLRVHLELLDRNGIASYSEVSNPVVLDLAQRHGYRRMGDPFTLPDGTQLWPVWRPPGG